MNGLIWVFSTAGSTAVSTGFAIGSAGFVVVSEAVFGIGSGGLAIGSEVIGSCAFEVGSGAF